MQFSSGFHYDLNFDEGFPASFNLSLTYTWVNYLKKCAIIHQLTVPYTSEQKGKAERMSRSAEVWIKSDFLALANIHIRLLTQKSVDVS